MARGLSRQHKEYEFDGTKEAWSKEEIAILRELFGKLDWRTTNKRRHILVKKVFLKKVQRELFERLRVNRSYITIRAQMKREFWNRQWTKAQQLLLRRFKGSFSQRMMVSHSPKRIAKKLLWRYEIEKQITAPKGVHGVSFIKYFREEREILQIFNTLLSEIEVARPNLHRRNCPIRCNFVRLMGAGCAESLDMYHYAIAVSGFIAASPATSLRGVGEMFVERYPEARPLLSDPFTLDAIIRAFCRMLNVNLEENNDA